MLALLGACAHDPYRVCVDTAPWIRALGSDDLDESDAAEDSFLGLGPAAVAPLAAALQREPAAVRLGVAETLTRLRDPRAVAALVLAASNDPDVEVRYEALRSLPPSDDPAIREIAERSLGDRDPRIRHAGARLCGSVCSSPRATEQLMEMSVADAQPGNAAAARASLAQILGREAAPSATLRARVVDFARAKLEGRGEERVRAALLLSRLSDPAAVPVLIETATTAESPLLQVQAVYALGELGDERAVRPLADLLGSTPAVVAMYSYQGLSTLAEKGVPGAAAALGKYPGTPPTLPLPRPGP